MVGWYAPRQLLRTAVQVVISTIFAQHSDQRRVQAAGSQGDPEIHDYTYFYKDDGNTVCQPDEDRPRDSIWIDYAGDVGDGWNSTYAIATNLAQPSRTFEYTDGKNTFITETKRGDILIFGGDEVYPTASADEYQERLLAPYETATRTRRPPFPSGPSPHVFAIPGNHDWYDSLVAFSDIFAWRPWFAGWRTRQGRSYFVLKLPHNWWLFGVDVQLGSDLDSPQLDYFKDVGKLMDAETGKSGLPASIILCVAEPIWLEEPRQFKRKLDELERNLDKHIAVFIAGDLHHYRRYESQDMSIQKIIAGGGGAFLHPTHTGIRGARIDTLMDPRLSQEREPRDRRDNEIFHEKKCFPLEEVSRKLCWWNLIFPYRKGNGSGSFGFVTGLLYVLLTLPILGRLDDPRVQQIQPANIIATLVYDLVNSPMTSVFVVLTIVAIMVFSDRRFLRYRVFMGGLHGLSHVFAAFTLGVVSASLVVSLSKSQRWSYTIAWGGYSFHPDLRVALAILIVLLSGYVIGSLIVGIYLLVSLNFFGCHSNEAFSSLSIEDWKNFLRLHIDEQGSLTIYPVGIKRVPRKWKKTWAGDTGPELISDDPKATEPELIEAPIVLIKAQTDTGVKTFPSELKLEG
jgi:hypothetical protein